MAMIAVLMPVVMLVVMLALGRYEELMLPFAAEEPESLGDAAVAGNSQDGAEDREMFEARA